MRKIYNESQFLELSKYSREIIESTREIISILNENYGEDREVDNDLGGYILIAENIVDIEVLKQDKLQGLVPEYTDVIECSEGVNWTSSLFLLSSDFSILVVTTEELSKFLLE
ncbi:hypothetical protein SAMN02745248_01169 [Hathewaya proteolytica DSM 3090]|uniref:Uncharacterized protein n=1 Tax=Hathewaya proteolytica DSM 3090 TaxID=1121331 RepID=A0A1M6MTV8_9CLOT|nr:hypothetical protein [Hathewaya proteolytica]SHJ86911.1 hypothetical protein SAMN02745248_01169 [Hathewaya proteolytica DSM 3090]